MRYLRIATLCVALLFVFAQADAQSPDWTWTSITANNGTVIFPYANTPTFNDEPIAVGDWIGGFGADNDFCVGAVAWELNQPPQLANGLTVWGDDEQTPVVDGLVGGEVIQYRLWRQEDGQVYDATAVVYASGSSNTTGEYLFNGIWIVGSMTFEGGPPTFSISGTITYANTANTPMTNTNVALVSGELVIAETTTEADGSYSFANVENGSYTIVATTDKAWGGSNNTDGIFIKRHIVAYQGFQLVGIQLKAADVQFNNIVNNTDAILIGRRVVGGNITAWTLPDWVFEIPSVVIDNADETDVNIKALCGGDVNGSYTPPL